MMNRKGKNFAKKQQTKVLKKGLWEIRKEPHGPLPSASTSSSWPEAMNTSRRRRNQETREHALSWGGDVMVTALGHSFRFQLNNIHNPSWLCIKLPPFFLPYLWQSPSPNCPMSGVHPPYQLTTLFLHYLSVCYPYSRIS
jgi:hypothetical protein